MGAKVKDNVTVTDAAADDTLRNPDGGFVNVATGDKVYTTENGWVYSHAADDEPDWDEVAKSHSNSALVSDLLDVPEDSDKAPTKDDKAPTKDDDSSDDDSFPGASASRRKR